MGGGGWQSPGPGHAQARPCLSASPALETCPDPGARDMPPPLSSERGSCPPLMGTVLRGSLLLRAQGGRPVSSRPVSALLSPRPVRGGTGASEGGLGAAAPALSTCRLPKCPSRSQGAGPPRAALVPGSPRPTWAPPGAGDGLAGGTGSAAEAPPPTELRVPSSQFPQHQPLALMEPEFKVSGCERLRLRRLPPRARPCCPARPG